MSGPVRAARETVLYDALLELADMVERELGPESWNPHEETVVVLSTGRTISAIATRNRSFAATCVDGDTRIAISCPILDEFENILDDDLRVIAHARWCARVLKAPRSRNRDPTWVETATVLAAMAAGMHQGASGACTLQPGPCTDPIKVESTGHPGWRMAHTEAVVDHVARTCPPWFQVNHGRDGEGSRVTIDHGPRIMCFAMGVDPLERMRLMLSTGLDPADLFRVEGDHG